MRGMAVALILGSLAAMLATRGVAAGELRLTVKGVRSSEGELLIGLYDNAAGFKHAIANASNRGMMPDKGRLVGMSLRARPGEQSVVFPDLSPGRYAVIVIHDENDDGRLDKNLLGLPTEGYGFGNDAKVFLAAPSFDAAAIPIATADVAASVTLHYPLAPSAEQHEAGGGNGSARAMMRER